MNTICSTAYLPNLHYLFYVINSNEITIEQFEFYEKQSFKNRTHILTANGVLSLTIPVLNNHGKSCVKDIKISYKENWQKQHWGAITSAYKNSPYFDFFEDDFKGFYSQKMETLLDFNTQQLTTILKLLQLKKEISFTSSYNYNIQDKIDTRRIIHPKLSTSVDKNVTEALAKPYYQTFGYRHGFTPNLSCLDALFNIGLTTKEYLSSNFVLET